MEFLFPYDNFRKIQKSFMLQVYHTIKNKGQLLVHAPTGIGKTSSALSPALTYVLKEDKKKVIFFLTSRNTQHLIAVETLKEIKKKHDIEFTTVDLIGKRGMCNQAGVQQLKSGEFIEYCKDLREKGRCDYFKNLKTKTKTSEQAQNVLETLKKQSPLHVEEINSICFNADLCSYEMACLLGKVAQVVIGDYNYMLNPHIRAGLLTKMNKSLKDCIIIFDEGHNVPHRARDLLTSQLTSFILDNAAKETMLMKYDEIAQDILAIKKIIENIAKEEIGRKEDEALITKQKFYKAVEEMGNYEEIMGNFVFVGDQVLEKKKKSFTASLATFMESWLGPSEGFTRIITKGMSRTGRTTYTLNYRCLDPAIIMNSLLSEAHATITMSGTLSPIDMYEDLLGVNKEKCITLEYKNPFPQENRLALILPETSTKYKTRGSMMYEKIAKKCAGITNTVPGNSVIFFPSYKLRDEVYEYLRIQSDKTLFLEETEYTKEQRGNLLERFKEYKDRGALLLAVAGGSFAEGIDLPGDLLKCVIVVGLPLGRPDLETKELINYYDKRFSRGWDYGYVYPAIIKILQSAGRCIRSETDRGVIVFLDERYVWQNYKKCFPDDMNMQVKKDPIPLIQEFF